MYNKLEKLKELNYLLKSKVISQEEFELLKNEILNNQYSTSTISDNKKIETKILNNKEKISLKSFHDNNGNFHKAPDIEYLSFKDMSNVEINLLKPFIRQKQIYSPSEMTKDEIKIGNKLFSIQEIAEMNSERPGFNYAFASIISVIGSGCALFLITISPCFIIIGAGSGLFSSVFISLYILSKVDATKLDKTFAYISIALGIITTIVYFN